MYHSNGLEYIVGNSYSKNSYSRITYFSQQLDDNYGFVDGNLTTNEVQYIKMQSSPKYKKQQYFTNYSVEHSFAPEIFLSPSRPKSRFVVENNEARTIAAEIFELMLNGKIPESISINVLSFDEFKALHSRFGTWSNGILGFSINGIEKQIFARENHLDALMLVIGHEIGHVLTETLPNKLDEEAKAFAFSVEWAKTIKKHNVANLGLSIKDEISFHPARNGLHDVAFGFVDLMARKGRKAINLHSDLIKCYVSVFDRVY